MKPLPRRLLLAGNWWKVRRVARLGCNGEADFNALIIRVKRGIAPELAWTTLVHEILHVMDEATQPNTKEDGFAERFIERVDSPLLAALRDNFKVGE